jgi:DNA-binding MarR family transcriptional regulator
MNTRNKAREDAVIDGGFLPGTVPEYLSNLELWGTLTNTHYAISRSRFLEVSKHGLTPQKAQILYVIQTNDGAVLQNKVSSITMRRQHSVSDLVNRMVREGLIAKKRLPNDRKYLLTITKKGKIKHDKLTRQSIEMIFSVLTTRDRQVMASILKKLLDESSAYLGFKDKSLLLSANEGDITSNFVLWGLLARTDFALSRSRFHEIAAANLTLEKAKILHIIHAHQGSIPQNRISEITMRRQHSVSDLVNRMVKEGLIIKTKRAEDRIYVIKMSKKGKERYYQLSKNNLDIIFSVLTQEERRDLHTVLNKLLDKSRSLLGLDYTVPF